MQIITLSQAPPVTLAAQELARYLAAISPGGAGPSTGETGEATTRGLVEPGPVKPGPVKPGPVEPAGGLRVGTFADFGAGYRPWPAVPDATLDDAIYIETAGAAGIVAGSNPRSVLLAAYRYLTELGCRWVRLGADGEYLPRIDLSQSAVRVAEAASYRHRGICIEGAVSYEHVRDVVDWAPRLGFNTYFIQFRDAYTFFERWYSHRGNPLLPPEPCSVEQARALKARLAAEITRRGLVFHDVGHGWTCEPLGAPGLGWEYAAPPVPPGVERYLAEIDGRRTWWRGVPLNTNLCYSNPQVRALVVGDVAGYARAHPEVDALHVWLADGSNNHCECAQCRQARPSDWYVRLLNDIDARLTAEGAAVRIVFLIYVDLLWPPETERLAHPERFILMFAPITRTYSAAFASAGETAPPALPPYEHNRLRFPRSVAENVAFLRTWQGAFSGDSFDFDYHFMWDHYRDPGQVAIASVLHQDVQGLAALGLDGLVSCQVQRAFFPTGLGMAVLGRTLWNARLGFAEIAADYFQAAFGIDGPACLAYCHDLTAAFDPPYLRGEQPRVDAAKAAAYAQVPEYVARFRPVIQRNLATPVPCHARSWHYLDVHAEVCVSLAEALRHRASGDDAAARLAWEQVARRAQECELDLQSVLDVYEFVRVLGRLFEPAG